MAPEPFFWANREGKGKIHRKDRREKRVVGGSRKGAKP